MYSKKDSRILERVKKHRKAISKGSTTKTERMYQRGSKNSSISSITVAQETLERSEEFEVQRARFLLLMDKI